MKIARINEVKQIEPRPAQWRGLWADPTGENASTVWAPNRGGWSAGFVTQLGKNRAERTVVSIKITTGSIIKRHASTLYWRDEKLKGKDKPPHEPVAYLTAQTEGE